MNRDSITENSIGTPVDLQGDDHPQSTLSMPAAENRIGAAPKSGKVLVLGEDSKILLPILRSLGRKQITVDVAWAPHNSALARSRYLRKMHDLPSYQEGDNRWMEALISLAKQENYDLIIPATEASLWPFTMHRELAEQMPELIVLNEQAAKVAFDKSQLQDLAIELEIPTPTYCRVNSWQEFAHFVNRHQTSVVFKPLCSLPVEQIQGKQFVRIVRDSNDLRDLQDSAVANWPAIAQVYFEGQGGGIEFLADGGELLFAFQHQRLHETVGYGSTYRQSVPLQPEMLEAVRKLIQATNYTGVGMAEFRVNPFTGQWILLEINGRFWGSLALAIAAQADFPYYLYCVRVLGQPRFPQTYRIGVRCRDLTNDTRWCWRAMRGKYHSASDAALESQGWEINRKSRWNILGNLLRIPIGLDRYDSFAWDDLKPFWFECRQLTRLAARN